MTDVLFLDTAGLVSVFNKDDDHHQDGAKFWKEEILANLPHYRKIFLSDYILDEIATLIRKRKNHQTAISALNQLLAFVESDNFIKTIWVDKKLFVEAKKKFKQMDDREYWFTDCTSFVICDEQDIDFVFTFDQDDFKSAGFVPKPH